MRFGRRLYDAFFRSYTEKVWGIPGSEIRSQWAAQRIKNFSMGKAMLSAVGLRRSHVTTLIEEFSYPRLGPGQLWNTLSARLQERGMPFELNHRCTALNHHRGRIESIVVQSNGDVTGGGAGTGPFRRVRFRATSFASALFTRASPGLFPVSPGQFPK